MSKPDAWGFRDEDYGGNHSNGTGTYEARTPEQARALYAQLPKGSRDEADALERESREKHPEYWQKEKR